MEVFVTVGLGIAAGSLALIAFGLDSLVEVFASLVVVWYIADDEARGRERRALHLVAIAFAVLALYLAGASIYNLATGEAAESSPLGIGYLAITALVMFGLSVLKRRIAREAANAPLAAKRQWRSSMVAWLRASCCPRAQTTAGPVVGRSAGGNAW